MEFKKIHLTRLDFNTGQIPGLPPNPREWKDAEIKRLAKSMKGTPELTEARGCIVVPYEGRYVVLGGNLRLAAAKYLKWPDIMCAVLPEGTKVSKLKEIVLKDNSSFGSWDLSLLRKDWAEFNFGDWGIDVTWDTAGPEPDASVSETPQEVVEDDFDETTSDIAKRCSRGDIWQLGDHRLMCGDSTKVDDVQMLMGGQRLTWCSRTLHTMWPSVTKTRRSMRSQGAIALSATLKAIPTRPTKNAVRNCGSPHLQRCARFQNHVVLFT